MPQVTDQYSDAKDKTTYDLARAGIASVVGGQ